MQDPIIPYLVKKEKWTMQGSKGLLESKTIWGGVVTILAGALGLGHYTISSADQAGLVDLLSSAASVVGGLVAIYGRIVASKPIEVRK